MAANSFKKVYSKLFFIFIFLIVTCCNLIPSNSQKTRIRVVDVDGNPKEIKRYVPTLNAEALAKQGYKVNVDTGELEPISPTAPNLATSQVASNQINYETNVPVTSINNSLAETSNPANEITQGDLLVKNQPITNEQSKKQTIVFQSNKNKLTSSNTPPVEYDLSGTGPIAASPSETSSLVVGKMPEETPKKKFNILIEKATDSKTNSKFKSKAEKFSPKSPTGGLFIQIGSFTSAEIANEILAKNQNIHQGKIEEATINNKKTYRVLLGPVKDQNEADKVLNKVISSGRTDAFITKNKR